MAYTTTNSTFKRNLHGEMLQTNNSIELLYAPHTHTDTRLCIEVPLLLLVLVQLWVWVSSIAEECTYPAVCFVNVIEFLRFIRQLGTYIATNKDALQVEPLALHHLPLVDDFTDQGQ